jgi:hypothetical protein
MSQLSLGSWRVAIVTVAGLLVLGWTAAPVASADSEPAAGTEVVKVSGEAFGTDTEFDAKIVVSDGLGVTALQDKQPAAAGSSYRADAAAALAQVSAAAGIPTVTFHDEVSEEPKVELPDQGGGPLKDTEETTSIKFFGQPVRLFSRSSVETEGAVGADGSAESSAHASHLGNTSFIDEIDSECRADRGDVDGSTEIESSRFSDVFPKHPKPNTVIQEENTVDTDPTTGVTTRVHFRQVVNEQDEDEHSITVTAYHEHEDIEVFDPAVGPDPVEFEHFDARIAQSHCDVVPGAVTPVVVEPTFTG